MNQKSFNLSCPISLENYPHVLLAHGGGGRMMQDLINKIFKTAFENPLLQTHTDSALLPNIKSKQFAFTTDSFVVKPIFFPGGDIGSLAVYGTVNDLAMNGAKPLYLSVSFILEEGMPLQDLWRISLSMGEAAKKAGVQIVTGDTKVVEKGACEKIFINTSGVGEVLQKDIGPSTIKPGDVILINGDLGRHGMAIMSAREGLNFETSLQSDCAPLNLVVEQIITAGIELHCLRDLTRGGLATALVELAESSGHEINIEENLIALQPEVQGACEILGLDPLYVANEGRMVLIIPKNSEKAALEILKHEGLNPAAVKIGEIKKGKARVNLKSPLGVARVLDRLSGEQLPRIC